jgi:hypothetical protein
VVQLGLTAGCAAVGIEIDEFRNELGCALKYGTFKVLNESGVIDSAFLERADERIELIHGDLRDHYDKIRASTVIHMNNVGDYLREADKSGISIHDFVEICFGQGTVGGSSLCACHILSMLCFLDP